MRDDASPEVKREKDTDIKIEREDAVGFEKGGHRGRMTKKPRLGSV